MVVIIGDEVVWCCRGYRISKNVAGVRLANIWGVLVWAVQCREKVYTGSGYWVVNDHQKRGIKRGILVMRIRLVRI